MASIFRQKYTKIDKKTSERVTKQSKKWYIEYVDAKGVPHRVPGYADK